MSEASLRIAPRRPAAERGRAHKLRAAVATAETHANYAPVKAARYCESRHINRLLWRDKAYRATKRGKGASVRAGPRGGRDRSDLGLDGWLAAASQRLDRTGRPRGGDEHVG